MNLRQSPRIIATTGSRDRVIIIIVISVRIAVREEEGLLDYLTVNGKCSRAN